MRHECLVSVLLIANMLMATRLTLTLSLSRSRSILKRTSPSIFNPNKFPKSLPCPLWSSSFSFCIDQLHKSTSSNPFTTTCSFSSPLSSSSMAASSFDDSNPLLQDFVFPPFDAVEPKHVRPGIRALLNNLVIKFLTFAQFWIICSVLINGSSFDLICRNVIWRNLNVLLNLLGLSWLNRWRRLWISCLLFGVWLIISNLLRIVLSFVQQLRMCRCLF